MASAPVRLTITPEPAYVRTVRLVAEAVARQAGVADEVIDEVKLATSEACNRAVAAHRRSGITDMIDVAISDDGDFTVWVSDRAPAGDVTQQITLAPARDSANEVAIKEVASQAGRTCVDEDAVSAGAARALLTGLAGDLAVIAASEGSGTQIRMTWPISPDRRA